MIVIHLDTNYLIQALAPGSAQAAQMRAWIHDGTRLAISVISWTEFLCGPLKATEVDLARQILGEPVLYSAAEASRASSLFNLGGQSHTKAQWRE